LHRQQKLVKDKSYSLLIYTCDLQDIASAFLVTHT